MTQKPLGTILLVCTSHSELGKTGNNTGFWIEELAAPYYAFKDAGYKVAIASPRGGTPPVDPGSLSKDMRGPIVDRFEANAEASAALSSSTSLDDIVGVDAFAGVFLVGGHGTMWDFPQNANLARLVEQALTQGKAIGAVCHGVAGLLAGNVPALLKGKSVAGFSNAEETAVGLTEVVPFLLETKLVEAGFDYRSGPVFSPNVVTDGMLVTGQNPPSSLATAEAMIAVLSNG